MSKELKYQLILTTGGINALEFVNEMISNILKDSIDLQYMTSFTALKIIQGKIIARICDLEHSANSIKLEISKKV